MSPSPPPPPVHTVRYSGHHLDIHTPAPNQTRGSKSSWAPLGPPVPCPVVTAHNTNIPIVSLQVSRTPEVYAHPQYIGEADHPHQYPASTHRILLAEQSSRPHHNGGSPKPRRHLNTHRDSPIVRTTLENSNTNASRLCLYTKFHHPLPSVPPASPSPICQNGQLAHHTNVKCQPHTPSPTKRRSMTLSGGADITLADKHALRHAVSLKSTLSSADTIEIPERHHSLDPIVRTESEEARLGEFGCADVHRLSQHSERSGEAEVPRQTDRETQRSVKEDPHRSVREGVQRLAEEKTRRQAAEEAQSCEGKEAKRAEEAWNKDLPKREAVWKEGTERRKEVGRRQEAANAQKVAIARRAAEAQVLSQKTADNRIQGPRQKSLEPQTDPQSSIHVPADAIMSSPRRIQRQEAIQRGDELRRKLEQTAEEVWREEDARAARRGEEERARKMKKAREVAAAPRTTKAIVPSQSSPEAEPVPNAPYLDRNTRRRIAEAYRDGHPELARAMEHSAGRSQYPANMNINSNNVNVTYNFQGKAARRAARIAQGRDSWLERMEDEALECCCTVM